jgi:hypothetical protein
MIESVIVSTAPDGIEIAPPEPLVAVQLDIVEEVTVTDKSFE